MSEPAANALLPRGPLRRLTKLLQPTAAAQPPVADERVARAVAAAKPNGLSRLTARASRPPSKDGSSSSRPAPRGGSRLAASSGEHSLMRGAISAHQRPSGPRGEGADPSHGGKAAGGVAAHPDDGCNQSSSEAIRARTCRCMPLGHSSNGNVRRGSMWMSDAGTPRAVAHASVASSASMASNANERSDAAARSAASDDAPS